MIPPVLINLGTASALLAANTVLRGSAMRRRLWQGDNDERKENPPYVLLLRPEWCCGPLDDGFVYPPPQPRQAQYEAGPSYQINAK